MRSVSSQPGLPAAAAAARASASTSSGTPASCASSSMCSVHALVASSRCSSKRVDRSARSSCSALYVALSASFSSAPPRRKSRSSLSMNLRCAASSAANAGHRRAAPDTWRTGAGPARGRCRTSTIFGRFALYASRSSGVLTTALRCCTAPHARCRRSSDSVSGSTSVSHVGAPGAVPAASIVARASASRRSIAGVTCSVRIASKRGRPEKSSSGLAATGVVLSSMVRPWSGCGFDARASRLVGGEAARRVRRGPRACPRWPRGHRSAPRRRGRGRSSRDTAEAV